MPTIIHESTGLKIVINDRNQFAIASLHYTADPRKRSPEWVREAKAGMEPSKAQREYELDYSATQGAKAFPEMVARKSDIVVPAFDIPQHQRCWGGFDYGTRNPASFHVYTILQDTIYAIWELYKPCKNITDYVAEMRECPYWKQIRYIAADPSLWVPNQQQAAGAPIGIADKFWNEGVRTFYKGRADAQAEETWLAMLRQHWQLDDPTFKIFDTCPNLVWEFETAIYQPQSERQLLTDVYKENLADRNNHALDDCKYFMLTRPPVQAPLPFKHGTIDQRWSQRPVTQRPQPKGRTPVGGYR